MHRSSALLVLGLVTAAASAGPARAAVYHENLTFQVVVGDSVSPAAAVYDSEDFQYMLILGGGDPPLLLELGTDSVYELAGDDVGRTDDGVTVSDEQQGMLATILTKEEGAIVVDLGETVYRLTPMPPLVGVVELEDLLAVKPAYRLAAQAYEPNREAVAKIAAVDHAVSVTVFFGTWCHLCKNLVPKLMGTLDAAANPRLTVQYIGVSEAMDEPEELLHRHGVTKTPTFIFVVDGAEIGRIEEKAEPSVEEAVAAILSGS